MARKTMIAVGLSLGILVSILAKSQVLACQVAIIASYLPAFLLSGFMFDIVNMPKPLQIIALAVPARYFITLARGIMLKGVGPSVLWPYGLGMLLFGAIGLVAAVRAFKKEIA